MKKLLGGLLLFAAVSLSATPVSVNIGTFTQDEWSYNLVVTTDSTIGGDFFVNGTLASHGSIGFGIHGLLPETGPLPIGMIYGVNTLEFHVDGEVYTGPTFTLVQPTTPYPTPDGGSTIALLALGCLGLFHRRLKA